MDDHEIGGAGRPVFLRCADRFGREVVIYQDIWYEHIMIDHGELSGREDAVRITREQPNTIREDRAIAYGELSLP